MTAAARPRPWPTPPARANVRRAGGLRCLVASAALALGGCPGPGGPPAGPGGPGAADAAAAAAAEVARACGGCHLLPPPEALPRARWAEVIPTMVGLPGPPGATPLDAEGARRALAWYLERAPDALPQAERAPALSERLRFEVAHHTPKAFEERRIPAVANVAWAELNAKGKRDLLVSEMRTRAAWILAPWAPPAERRLLQLARDLRYPVGARPVDLDGDGRLDLLVPALGDMDPSNDVKGALLLARQTPERRFETRVLADGLARVCDARAADLDGDGDLDLVVCAFGWRGPGDLRVLARTGPGLDAFTPHVLDRRDGWIHAVPVDLDGDGRLDLVGALSQEHEQVVWWRNEGDLRFAPRVLDTAPHPAWGTSGLEVVDLDGDGDLDVLVSNGDALDDALVKPYHGVAWLEQTAPGTFVRRPIGALAACERAVPADLDGDGDLDVVAVAFLPQVSPATQRALDLDSVVWFERTPAGWVRHALEKHLAIHPTVDVADHDGDGLPDIAVGNYVWLVEDGKPLQTAPWVTVFTQRPRPTGPAGPAGPR